MTRVKTVSDSCPTFIDFTRPRTRTRLPIMSIGEPSMAAGAAGSSVALASDISAGIRFSRETAVSGKFETSKLNEGSQTEIFYFKQKYHSQRFTAPGPDCQCASCGYGLLRMQKLTLSVFNDVKLPGQSFHESKSDCSFLLIIVDNYLSGLVTSYLCFFLRIPTDGFVFANKSTIRFPEPLPSAEAKRLFFLFFRLSAPC